MHCSAVVMHSFSRKSIVSAAAAAADGHAGGDTNGWKHDNLECQPLNSTIACSPVACSPVVCSPVACSPLACSPIACSPIACSPVACSPVACSPVACSPVAFSSIAGLHVHQLSVCMMVACCTGSGQPLSESELSPTSSFESVVLGRQSAVISLASCVHFRAEVLTLLL